MFPSEVGIQQSLSPLDKGHLTNEARLSAYVAIGSASLFLLGLITPMVSHEKLSDGGSAVVVAYVLPVIACFVLAGFGLQGRDWAARAASGVVLGLATFTFFFLVEVYQFISSVDDYYSDDKPSFQIAFYLMGLGLIAAVVAVVYGCKGTKKDEGGPFTLPLLYIGAACFAGIPLAALTESNGRSIWDVQNGSIQFGFVVWAVVAPAVAVLCALQRSIRILGVSIGVAIAYFGVVVGTGLGSTKLDTSSSLLNFDNGSLFNLSVVAALVLCVLALLKRPGMSTAGFVPGYVPAAPLNGVVSPPQWAPDPFQRHELRYWDGQQWTATVADGGITAMDPPTMPPPASQPSPPPLSTSAPYAPPMNTGPTSAPVSDTSTRSVPPPPPEGRPQLNADLATGQQPLTTPPQPPTEAPTAEFPPTSTPVDGPTALDEI